MEACQYLKRDLKASQRLPVARNVNLRGFRGIFCSLVHQFERANFQITLKRAALNPLCNPFPLSFHKLHRQVPIISISMKNPPIDFTLPKNADEL